MTIDLTALGPMGWAHVACFGVLLPLLTLLSRGKVGANMELDRARYFRQAVPRLIGLAIVSLGVASAEHIELLPPRWPGVTALGAGIAAYALAVAVMRPRWRRAVKDGHPGVQLFMPRNAKERGWWLAASVLAGVGEEITWRGVQTALLYALTGNFMVAALGSAASFGVAHAAQGWAAVGIYVIFALGLQGLAWLDDSLYVAMAVHTAYDITVVASYGRLAERLGYVPRCEELSAAAEPMEASG